MNEQNKKVPTIRFKGFTDDWEQRKLGEVAEIVGGGTPSTKVKEYWDGDINWYSPVEIGNSIYASGSVKRITKLGLEKSSAKILPKGTVLFTSRAGIGNTAILSKEAATNQGFQSIVPKKKLLDSYFIFTETPFLKKYGEINGAGSTFVEVSGKQMAKMPLRLPLLEEQKKIGVFFKQIDSLIALHQRKLVLLKQLKKGLLQKMFVGKHSKQPVLRFKGFHDDWEQRKLGDLFAYNRPDKYMVQDTNYINSGTPVLTANKSFVLGYTNENHTYNKLPAIIFDDFTLENKFVNFPFMVKSSAIKILNSRNDQPMMFMYQLLQHSRFVHEGHSRHYISIVQRKDVMIPDNVEEQKKIATLFSRIQNIIALQHQKLAKYQSVKKSLLQQMFI